MSLTMYQVNHSVCIPIDQCLTTINPPADIVKVRLQTTTQYSSAFDCASQILKKEGPFAFYKGTLTPLIGIGACVWPPQLTPLYQL
jgi:hypothetical protein